MKFLSCKYLRLRNRFKLSKEEYVIVSDKGEFSYNFEFNTRCSFILSNRRLIIIKNDFIRQLCYEIDRFYINHMDLNDNLLYIGLSNHKDEILLLYVQNPKSWEKCSESQIEFQKRHFQSRNTSGMLFSPLKKNNTRLHFENQHSFNGILFPNPNMGNFTLSFYPENVTCVKIEIRDLHNHIVYCQIHFPESGFVTMELSIAPANYFLNVINLKTKESIYDRMTIIS